MHRTIIWDFDGTLAERREGWSGAIVETIRHADPSSRVTPAQIRDSIRTGFPWHAPDRHHPELAHPDAWWATLVPLFEKAMKGVGLAENVARRLAEEVRERYLHPREWYVFDDTFSTLDHLSEAGWRHVIFSNHVPELETIVDFLGLKPRIARIFNSAHIHYEKPNPRAFAHVVEAIGPCEKVWMIGDNVKADVAGARAAGIPAILVRKSHPDAEVCCGCLADVIPLLDGPSGLPGS